MSREQEIINNFIEEYKLDHTQLELVQQFIKYYKSKISKGRPQKYATPEEAYQAKLAQQRANYKKNGRKDRNKN